MKKCVCGEEMTPAEWKNQWVCHRCGRTKPMRTMMTNADRIRAMSDEELAKLLLDGCRGSKCDDQPQNEWGSVNCFECRMKWLQMPVEEADHG